MRILMTGGTGTISRAVTARILAEGHELTVLNRGKGEPLPEGVQHVVGDAHDARTLASVVTGAGFDAMIQFVAFTGEDVTNDLSVIAGEVGQYVFISSCSTYAKPVRNFRITEDTPQANPHSQYARDKIAGEEVLRDTGSDVNWTIVRPSHTYGERVIPTNFHFGKPSAALVRMLAGRPMVVHGDGESLWTFTWNEDFAVGLVGLLGNREALGRAVHITSDESVTWNEAFRTVAEVIEAPAPDLVHVSSEMLAMHRAKLEADLIGDKAATVMFDNTLIKRLVPAFDATTTWRQGAERAWAWMQAHPESLADDQAYQDFCDDIVSRVRDWA